MVNWFMSFTVICPLGIGEVEQDQSCSIGCVKKCKSLQGKQRKVNMEEKNIFWICVHQFNKKCLSLLQLCTSMNFDTPYKREFTFLFIDGTVLVSSNSNLGISETIGHNHKN